MKDKKATLIRSNTKENSTLKINYVKNLLDDIEAGFEASVFRILCRVYQNIKTERFCAPFLFW